MTNIIDLPVITYLDLAPERVLDAAKDSDLEYVVIIGQTKDGKEYFSSSKSDGPTILWDLERAKLKLLQVIDENND